jgi:hypothetical protein
MPCKPFSLQPEHHHQAACDLCWEIATVLSLSTQTIIMLLVIWVFYNTGLYMMTDQQHICGQDSICL